MRTPVVLFSVTGLTILILGGCPMTPQAMQDMTGLDEGDNSTFAKAPLVELDNNTTQFTAEISSPSDVDIFNLGTLAAGDQVIVDVQTVSGNLDPLAAVFDDREFVFAFNDDRDPGSDLNPLMDEIIRGGTREYFLGVVGFPGDNTTGSYRVNITINRGVGVPDPAPQIVFLDYIGGQDILIENVGVFDINPFDAGVLGPYNTATMKRAIQDVVEDRYAGFNLIVENSDDDPRPTEDHSTIYFGGTNFLAFGISEQIDTLNGDRNDDAIIFVRSFRNAFSTQPSLNGMATAIGNTVAHEIGHLLGLVHTADCDGLMDSSCGNDSILFQQAFKLSPLESGTFPLGMQNAVELIEWALGTVE